MASITAPAVSLPWSSGSAEGHRFGVILVILMVLAAVPAVWIPWIQLPEPSPAEVQRTPPQSAQLLPPRPVEPPPIPVQPEPVEPEPVPEPKPEPKPAAKPEAAKPKAPTPKPAPPKPVKPEVLMETKSATPTPNPRKQIIPAGQPLPPQPSANEISPEALAKVNAVEKKAKKLSLMELTERTCKWPVGDPATSEFWFCGLPVQQGKPYCEAHVGVAFQPMSSRRDRKR